MDLDLKDKTVIVTGGAQGIGHSIAEKFLKEAANVIIVDINDIKGKEVVEKFQNDKAIFVKGDLTDNPEEIFDDIIEKHEQVDIVVNNAGVGNFEPYKKVIDLNVTACIALSFKFYEHITKSNRTGTIINISSIVGYRMVPYYSVYQASKTAVTSFTRSLGHKKNFEKSGVRVIGLCPGFTLSNLSANYVENKTKTGIDEELEYTLALPRQDVGAVSDAVISIVKSAPSGSMWVIEGGKLEEIQFQY